MQSRMQPNQLFLWPAEVLYVCRGNIGEFHEHYALSLWISFEGDFLFETPQQQGRFKAAILPPNVRHKLYAPDCHMAVLQVDPDSSDHRSLLQITNKDKIAELDIARYSSVFPQLRSLLAGPADCALGRSAFEAVLKVTLDGLPRIEAPLDRRIEQVVRSLKQDLPEGLTVEQLASSVELSSHRFMHLFKEQMGLPVRRYILWLRANRAVRLLKEGLSLTDAAHAAGFADSAHMSRTFKEMVGIHPSFFFKDSRFVQAHFCKVR